MIRRGLLATVLLAGLASLPAGSEPQPIGTHAGVRRGMTRAEVRQLLGQPSQISRQILFRRHLEQWHFAEPASWVEFNCVLGEEPYVITFGTGS